jgi:hypothetical protein
MIEVVQDYTCGTLIQPAGDISAQSSLPHPDVSERPLDATLQPPSNEIAVPWLTEGCANRVFFASACLVLLPSFFYCLAIPIVPGMYGAYLQ